MTGTGSGRVVASLAVLVLAGCVSATSGSVDPATSGAPDPGSTVSSGAGSAAAVSSSATSNAATSNGAAAGDAEHVLAGLAVKGRAPLTGYDRDEFGPAWTDDNDDELGHNGCDTRNDILRRDLHDETLKADTHGCLVLTGTLDDPYTGRTIAFVRGVGSSNAVQVDHVIALGDAWQTGAQQWSEQRRRDFANDPLELLAVDGPANESKGDGDAATWLPPNKPYRCAYVARQIAIKARYGLWVKPAEADAMRRVLSGCPGQRLP